MRHLLQPQRGDDAANIVLLVEDGLQVDTSGWLNQAVLILRRIGGAIDLGKLLIQAGETWLEAPSELVSRHVSNVGYSLDSLMRASSVVNCQLILA